MSAANDPSGDMFLARRFNFLGFPSERDKSRGGTSYTSYADLRSELGDDNAAALVTKIGVLATVHGLDKLGVPLHTAVDRILQSLTPDERRTMAQGGTVPRVQEIIQAEANSAKQQQMQSATSGGAFNPDAKGQYSGPGAIGRVGNMAMSAREGAGEGATASGTTRSGSSDLGSIKPENYASSHFASVGLSYARFSELRSQGFGEQQIIAAVGANRSLGLDANDNPAATARLQRDTPWAVPHLQQRGAELQGIRDIRQKAEKAEQDGKRTEADALRKQADTMQKKHDEAHGQDRERLSKEHPDRLPDYDGKYQRIHDNVTKGLSVGNPLEDKARLGVIESYRRNPEDAATRQNYAALERKMKADPLKRNAMAEVDKDVQQSHRAEKVEVKKNEVKVAANAAETAKGDAGLDFLNETTTAAAKPAKRADAPASDKEKSGEPAKADSKEQPKVQDKQAKTRTATAKPAAPTV